MTAFIAKYRNLTHGEPAPGFVQRTTDSERYHFDTVGGRYIVLAFFGTAAAPEFARVLELLLSERAIFDDANFAFFGVSDDPDDELYARLKPSYPGIRFFWDFDGTIARLYGSLPVEDTAGELARKHRLLWLIIDPMLPVHSVIPFQAHGSDLQEVRDALGRLPAVDRFTGTELQPPVLYLPRVLEPELCAELIAYYAREGGRTRDSCASRTAKPLWRSITGISGVWIDLLEMVSPDVTPEQGVTRYQLDPTQGPACAIAAGAATIYRNYFAPVGGGLGQTAKRQIDGLADLGAALSTGMKMPVGDLWNMQNGYALGTQTGLDGIARYLETLTTNQFDDLRGKLRIGIHRDVEVTESSAPNRPQVSQSFCSALPLAYSHLPAAHWQSFALLVLEAAYEATMWATVVNAQRGASNIVFLTLLGGGAFGNPSGWIYAAIQRALKMVQPYHLDVRFVSHGEPSKAILAITDEFR